MDDMPLVGILAAEAGDVGPGTLRSPQHRVIVFGFDRERVMTVAFDLVAQGADHLRVAGVATLSDVNVAASEFERRVNAHVRGVLHRLVNGKQRRDLEQAADTGDGDNHQHQTDRFALKAIVKSKHRLYSPACSAGVPASSGRSVAGSLARCGTVRMVIQML